MGVTVALGAWLIIASAHPYLEEGERFYEAQAYEKAVAKLTMAIGVPENSVADRRHAFELLARCHVALGRVDRAEEAFAQLLSRDASAPAPQAAPKVREAFARAKQQLYAADYVKLRALAAPANEVRVELIDPWSLAREVVLSEAGAGAFAESSLRLEEGRYAGPLANASQRYFVRALDGSKRELASLGTSTEPLKILVEAAPVASINLPPQPAPGPVLVAPAPLPEPKSRAPVWVAGAASAAALIAGVALAVASSSDSRSAGEAGFSSDRKALDDSARDKAIGANVLIGLAVVGGAGTVVLAWAW